jgi:hypothetical protein
MIAKKNDSTLDLGNTISAYECTTWRATIEAITDMVRVKVLPYHLIALAQMSPDSRCNCRYLAYTYMLMVFWMNYFLLKKYGEHLCCLVVNFQ